MEPCNTNKTFCNTAYLHGGGGDGQEVNVEKQIGDGCPLLNQALAEGAEMTKTEEGEWVDVPLKMRLDGEASLVAFHTSHISSKLDGWRKCRLSNSRILLPPSLQS